MFTWRKKKTIVNFMWGKKEAKHFKFYMENPDVHPFFYPCCWSDFREKHLKLHLLALLPVFS